MPLDRNAGPDADTLTRRIIGCATAVHRSLGPGLLESLYEECLDRKLRKEKLEVVRQPVMSVAYDGAELERTYRPDFVVAGEVVVEVKAVSHLLPLHQYQLLTYLKLSGLERGLIINFNTAQLVRGVRRVVLTHNG